ncbi:MULTISPECIES: helix-turn-helix domain-containing protein [unclassified Agreia]|uniref:helix-turn-helix domain-containing protein n=1 Tax=unclassified Agreia TaxID=2641148 RepID=UPI0006F92AE4|nr:MULTISPECIES: helix-turn-helix transcriptional regulator [unclassified Agreia]KQM59284.1 XRE family transcriptional regulator [Agreia sp. Leaf210]KQO09932.1 XRE family transcriptional regulator [Agreia sp. Leaf244]
MPVSPANASPEQLARREEGRRHVGAAIRLARVEAGLTQEALAIESGVTRNMLIYVEHGTRPLAYDRLFDIAAALGVDPASFFPAPKR